ncbi:MAG: DUF1810 domain-containing protein [Pseudomonadota bacterium]
MDLTRFVEAQDRHWEAICAELAAGRKTSHWMWYVFPQLRDLGRSERALYYGIADRAEATAYLADPVLGPRLRDVCALMLAAEAETAEEVLGPVDALKLRSSATLFDAIEPGAVFGEILSRFYAGVPDPETLRRL